MSGSRKAGGLIATAILLIVLISGGALLYANRTAIFKAPAPAPVEKSELARFATGPLARLETLKVPPPTPDHGFLDREGKAVRLADFRGKVVVLNLWAMWCLPCRTEMPTLARLSQLYADNPDLVVLPVNVDADVDARADGRSFIDVHEPLPFYTDPEFRLPFLLPDKGKMPQTVLLDRQGRIRATFAGEADWSSPEARALVDALLAEG